MPREWIKSRKFGLLSISVQDWVPDGKSGFISTWQTWIDKISSVLLYKHSFPRNNHEISRFAKFAFPGILGFYEFAPLLGSYDEILLLDCFVSDLLVFPCRFGWWPACSPAIFPILQKPWIPRQIVILKAEIKSLHNKSFRFGNFQSWFNYVCQSLVDLGSISACKRDPDITRDLPAVEFALFRGCFALWKRRKSISLWRALPWRFIGRW